MRSGFTIMYKVFILFLYFGKVFAAGQATIYFAAPLFNAMELQFNQQLTNALEQQGYNVILPQRNGFEYKVLREHTKKLVSSKEVIPTVRNLIYLLDIGYFIPKSDYVVALLDEPLDEGVIVELSYAHLMGKKTIGIRTTAKQPFGNSELLGGMHSFVAFQCDNIIFINSSQFISAPSKQILAKLAVNIKQSLPVNVHKNQHIPQAFTPLLTLAASIFNVTGDIHEPSNLQTIVKRYIQHKNKISKIVPNRVDFIA
jgi:nucleoside 2-deoxyribosyltransferase